MDEANAIYTIVIGGGALIAIITPMLKLNTSIVNLANNMEHMKELFISLNKNVEKNVECISQNKDTIHEISHELSNHETRIKSLEFWRDGKY